MNKNQNQKRSRGRGNGRRGQSRNSNFESNGPDVKVRGTAQQVLDKYLQLARDAQSGGDRIAAESYLQYAEHYYRIISADTQDHPSGYSAENRGDGQRQHQAVSAPDDDGGEEADAMDDDGNQAHAGNGGNGNGSGGNGANRADDDKKPRTKSAGRRRGPSSAKGSTKEGATA